MSVRELLRTYQVIGFVAILYLWSWSYWIAVGVLVPTDEIGSLYTLPGLWGPVVAGIVLEYARSSDVRSWLSRLYRWPRDRRWYVIAVGLVVVPGVIGEGIKVVLADVPMHANSVLSLTVTFAFALLVGGALEEIGLRGFAHHSLRERYGLFTTGAVIGVFWSVWHLPLQLLGVGYTGPFLTFAAVAIPISILLGWLYDSTGGSVPLVMIAHAVYDIPALVEAGGPVPDDVVTVSTLGVIAVYWLLAAALYLGIRFDLVPFRADERPAPSG